MARYLFNPTTHYNQTEGGGAISSVIISTDVDITNVPSIDLGFIRKNTTDVPNGVAGLDGDAKLIANLDWNKINSGKPTTLSGYGITDAINVIAINAANGVAGLDADAKLNVNLDWDKITTSKPTTLGGYGITDAINVIAINAANGVAGLDADAKLNVDMDWSKVTTGKPHTLTGYGIDDAVGLNLINVANGVAGLDDSGRIGNTLLPLGTGTTINGPVSISVGQVAEYKIVPYSNFNIYTVSTVGGTFTLVDDTISFTVTTSAGGIASITLNGAVYPLTISASGIVAPTVTSLVNNSTNISLTPNFTSSQPAFTGAQQTQDMVRWELATSNSFGNTVVQFYEGSSNLTSWSPSTALLFNTSYYIRVKHHSSLSGWSGWSTVVAFITTTGTAMTGPTTVYPNQSVDYNITDYIASGVYTISAVGGTYTHSNGTITFTVTGSAGDPASITLNGQVYPLTILASGVVAPTITSPSTTTNISLTPTFTSSQFAYLGTAQIQTRVNWELATSNSFGNTVVQFYEGVNNLESWAPSIPLSFNTSYYLRVKHFSAVGGWSEWSTVFTFLTVAGTGMTGPTTVYTNDIAIFNITDYIASGVYTISAVGGTVERVNGIISFTVTANAGDTATITFNGQLYPLTVLASGVAAPNITSHANNATDVPLTPSFTSSPFITVGSTTQTHANVRWELATDSNFTTIVDYYEGPSNLRAWSPSTSLIVNLTYYVRVKYRSNLNVWSEWSAVVKFNTIVDSNITGRSTVYTGEVVPYTINGYSALANYVISVVGGTYTHSNGTINFTVTANAGGIASITVNNTTRTLTVEASTITTPSIDSHANPATGVSLTPSFTSTAFVPNGAQQTQDMVRWELASDTNFTTSLQFYEGPNNLRSWTPSTMLSFNTNYYVRVRYHSSVSNWSQWSTVLALRTLTGTAMTGPTTVYTQSNNLYDITDRITGANYVITAVGGTIIQTQNGFMFTVTANAGGVASITLNGQLYTLTVEASRPNAPNITSPVNTDTGVSLTPSFAGSQFTFVGVSQTHDNTEWQLATDSGFTADVQNFTANSNSTTWTPTTSLTQNTLYYTHVRYHSSVGGWGEWSTSITFTTISANSSITGQGTVYAGETYTYNIVGYSGSVTYTVTCQGGTVSETNGVITFVVSPTATAPVSITVNGSINSLTLGVSTITTPTVTPLPNNGTNVSVTPTFTSSAFVPNGATQSQDRAEWQLATDSGFTTGVQNYTATSNFTTWTITTNLTQNTSYYVRVRYHSNKGITSDWSTSVPFTTTAVSTTITGATTVYAGETYTYNIVGYSGSNTYTVTCQGGTVSHTSGVITFIVSPTATAPVSITVNGSINSLTLGVSTITTPTVTSPGNNSTNVSVTPVFTSNAFASTGATQSQDRAEWQLATDTSFNSPVQTYTANSNYTTWTPNAALTAGTTYHVRVQYHSNKGITSEWSTPVTFTTLVVVASVDKPVIESPVSGAANVPLNVTFRSSTPVTTGSNNTVTSARWELDTSNTFITPQVVMDGTTNITTWSPAGLTANNTYYLRVRYNGSVSGPSAWSLMTTFSTITVITITKPTVAYPSVGLTEVPLLPTITTNPFESSSNTSTHTKTIWYIYKVSDNSVVLSTTVTTGVLTSLTLVTSLLPDTVYGVKCQHVDQFETTSQWSDVVQFTTAVDNGWVARLDGVSNYEAFYDSTVDSSGNTYTVGRDVKTNSGGYIAESALIAKWSPSGALLWIYRLASTTEHSVFMGVTCDSLNNIYAVGEVNIGSGLVGEGLITKWDSDGNLIWQKTVSALGGERYSTVTTNASGTYIYAVGYTGISQTSQAKPFVTRLDSSGVLSWHRLIYWDYDAVFNAATCDADGRLIAVGRFGGAADLGYTFGVMLKIDQNGDLMWKYVKGAPGYSTSFTNVKTAGSNFIYATGSEATISVSGCVLSKINPSGTMIWEKRLDGASGGWLNDTLSDVDVDTNEDIYAVGRIYNSVNDYDGFITKWTSAGICSWQRTIKTSSIDELTSIDLNGNNHISCAGTVNTPGVGFSQTVLKVKKNMTTIADTVLSGSGMSHVSIGETNLTTSPAVTPAVTNQTITLTTVTYPMADRGLIRAASDFYRIFSSI